MFKNFSRYLTILFILTAVACNVFANDISMRSYALPYNGSLQLTVPDSWQDQIQQPIDQSPPTIAFTAGDEKAFEILLSPMWAYKEDLKIPDLEDIKIIITLAAEEAHAQAVENSVSINEYTNESNSGYYFSATDKAPKPGEFKYMTQGMLRVGELFLIFRILTNDDSASVVADALTMLGEAVHSQK